ncbi:MAG: prolipoprotein diacylglyceryl transferase, partial [Methylococcales bacterium]|nr:prolipoprotein diacylglyceryl transferase [Methylococcales bacterium]
GIGMFFYGRWKKMPAWQTLDALLVGIIIGLVFASLSDFLAGPGYGDSTNRFWGIEQFGLRRHPVQIYSILGGELALAVWWWLIPRRKFDGQLFLTAISIYSIIRLFANAYHATPWIVGDGYHGVQLLAFFATVGSLILLAYFNLSTTVNGESS